jgi:hypothetical protein
MQTTFQSSLESGMSDQWPVSEPLKTLHATAGRGWLGLTGGWLRNLVPKTVPSDANATIVASLHEPVVPVGGNVFALGSDPMVPMVVAEADPDRARGAMRETAGALAALSRTIPETPLHAFYIETSIDMDFLGGAVTHEFLHAFQGALPDTISTDALTLQSSADLRTLFYRTDHHWNAAGQKLGYERLLSALSSGKGTPMVPVPTTVVTLPALPFSGSRARAANDFSRTEPFDLLTFNLPAHEVLIDGAPGQYGNREQYEQVAAGKAPVGSSDETVGASNETVGASNETMGVSDKTVAGTTIGTDPGFNHYGHCNGQDYAEVVFRFPENSGMGHLLVLSESYANPLKPLIASHYETTRFVDLRFYESLYHKPFNLAAYVGEHDIDQVLVMGSHAYFRKLPQWLGDGTHSGDDPGTTSAKVSAIAARTASAATVAAQGGP